VIQVQSLTKVYGGTTAISALDFQVERGEIVGFLGPNGAGKSTTMRILAGALGATGGKASIGGVDVFDSPLQVKRMVGYLPEVPPLYPEMTVREYLRYAGRIKQADHPSKAAERVIDDVGLREVAGRPIAYLSKGYRQRVGIAQALVHSPSVLILDEPASGLDPAQRVEIRGLIERLAEGDVTVILSTHVLPEVEAICDRAIVIHEGQIVSSDALKSLAGAGSEITLTVAIQGEGIAAALAVVPDVVAVHDLGEGAFRLSASSDVRGAVAAAAVPFGLLELSGRRSLEDAYMRLTGAA
jgi:ABC-2 type transport system ATP-binding protein